MSDLYIEKKFYKITHFKINRRLTYDILSKCLIYSIYKLENNYIFYKPVRFFNAMIAKNYHHPENILVRKGVSLSEDARYQSLLNEVPLRSKKNHFLINFANMALKKTQRNISVISEWNGIIGKLHLVKVLNLDKVKLDRIRYI